MIAVLLEVLLHALVFQSSEYVVS
jgi:hypothetical protein